MFGRTKKNLKHHPGFWPLSANFRKEMSLAVVNYYESKFQDECIARVAGYVRETYSLVDKHP